MKKKNIKRALLILSLVIVAAVAAYLRTPSFNIKSIDDMQPLTKSDRLMIFAPHCDDEALSSSGLIMKAVELGIPVKVVLLTNGDNNYFSTDIEFKTLYPTAAQFIKAGETRQGESLRAMNKLGVSGNDLIFLGFPDRGLKALYTRNWFSDKPYKSRGTRGKTAPYKLIYQPGVAYSGENLLRNIREVIKEFSPTIVISPDLDDNHPDHEYGAKFILMAMENEYADVAETERPRLTSYIIHFYSYPFPRGLHPDRTLLPPFSHAFHKRYAKLMLNRDEVEKKKDVVMTYKTQLKVPELRGLMKSFIRKNEIFETMPYPREQN